MAEIEKLNERLRSIKAIRHIIRSMKAIASIRWQRAHRDLAVIERFASGISAQLSLISAFPESASTEKPAESAEDGAIGLVVISSDKGLCGGFNIGISRFVESYASGLERAGRKVSLITIGRYARDYFRERGRGILMSEDLSVAYGISYDKSRELCSRILEQYNRGSITDLVIVFNKFVSFSRSDKVAVAVLPPDLEPYAGTEELRYRYLLGCDLQEMREQLFFEYLTSRFHAAINESVVAENAARMQAMTAAEDNIEKSENGIMSELNVARQESITEELLDIVTGGRAIRKAAAVK